ncbi:hypothetical protein BKA62DRAFT_748926 [Auriculariales sp. MPI-PUGE-AT-0066]|nr:hypothetical protein BKA62DRAFT_748926 [Auriculariales sp. MPI-PUGE-AT-0066]
MLPLTLFTLAAASLAVAQKDGPVAPPNADPQDTTQMRLTGKRFDFDQLPFQADTTAPTIDPVYRGPQAGYNNCTGAPSSQTANCQTLIVNSIDDFCLFAPREPSPIGDAEGEVVAWCTKPTHGARVIPAGTLSGVQFYHAPSYVAVTGFLNGANLNIIGGDDSGGELDSGGQDQRGNPIGGLAYSNHLTTTEGKNSQSVAWHLFIGASTFCMKLCDNNAANPSGICRHTLDRVGCDINVPASYVPDVFTSCESDDQAPVALDATAIPASSSCTTYQSTDIFPVTSGIPTATAAVSSPTVTGAASGSMASGAAAGSAAIKGAATTTARGSGAPGASMTSTPSDSASTVGATAFGAVLAGLLSSLLALA